MLAGVGSHFHRGQLARHRIQRGRRWARRGRARVDSAPTARPALLLAGSAANAEVEVLSVVIQVVLVQILPQLRPGAEPPALGAYDENVPLARAGPALTLLHAPRPTFGQVGVLVHRAGTARRRWRRRHRRRRRRRRRLRRHERRMVCHMVGRRVILTHVTRYAQ